MRAVDEEPRWREMESKRKCAVSLSLYWTKGTSNYLKHIAESCFVRPLSLLSHPFHFSSFYFRWCCSFVFIFFTLVRTYYCLWETAQYISSVFLPLTSLSGYLINLITSQNAAKKKNKMKEFLCRSNHASDPLSIQLAANKNVIRIPPVER